MSDFQKHNWYALGASAATLIIPLYMGAKFESSLIMALAVYLGANFPDLDTDSIPSKWAARFSILASVYFIYAEKPIYAAVIGIIYAAPKISKHRGWTHKFSTPALITAAVYILFREYALIAIAFSAGLIVHFMPDKLSPFKLKNWI